MHRARRFPICATPSKPSRTGSTAVNRPFSARGACLGSRCIPVFECAGLGPYASEPNLSSLTPTILGWESALTMPSLMLRGVDVMGEDLEQLKHRVPLLEFLNRHHWKGQRVGTGPEFVGLCPCMRKLMPLSTLTRKETCSIAMAAGGAAT